MSSLSLFEEKIKSAQNILIVTHVNPDGDALGAIISMKNVVEEKYQKKADAVIVGRYPDIYNFLPEKENLIKIEDFNCDKEYDVAIAVDVASKERMAQLEKTYNMAKFKVNIDHHKTNDNYGTFNLVDGNASSTGEVLYQFFKDLNANITKDTATAIYTSILTDTGCFKFKNTTKKAFLICAELLDKGIDPYYIADEIYDKKPKAMVLLNSYVVSNAKFLHNGIVAYSCVSLADLEKFGAETDYTEGIVEVLRQVDSVKIAILFKECKNGFTKVSFRSKDYDVAEISKKFDGGGHTNAAGCTIKKPVNIAVEKILNEVKEIL